MSHRLIERDSFQGSQCFDISGERCENRSLGGVGIGCRRWLGSAFQQETECRAGIVVLRCYVQRGKFGPGSGVCFCAPVEQEFGLGQIRDGHHQ